MTTLTPEQIKANFLEQQLQRANTRIEQLLVALGRIQGIAPNNAKVQAVISETLTLPYETEDEMDNAAWAKSFAETDTNKLQGWLDTVMAEGPVTELVVKGDMRGEWIEFQPVNE